MLTNLFKKFWFLPFLLVLGLSSGQLMAEEMGFDPEDLPSYSQQTAPEPTPKPQANPEADRANPQMEQQPRRRGFFRRFQGPNNQNHPNQQPQRQRFGLNEPPKQIALILPLSGKHAEAAKAVREGFLAAYYDTPQQPGVTKPTVRVYDTLKGDNITQIYKQAVDEGAELIVGPLAKEEVAQLSAVSQNDLSVPVLALNQSPAQNTSVKLIQFALAPEEEAAQIAFRAHMKGYQTTSIIVPDNTWGRRVAGAFEAQWKHLGGQVMRTVFVDPSQDQAASVRRLLGMEEIKYDPNTKKPILKEKDIDVILMAAPPELARQWKPLFDFYYAEAVPVYATSSIYSGTPDPKRDRDMNGVIFCDMPSLIQPEMSSKLLPETTLDEDSDAPLEDNSVRFFALGVDAYRISLRLNEFDSDSKSNFVGYTGELTLDEQYRIRRKLPLAQFKDGKPTPLS